MDRPPSTPSGIPLFIPTDVEGEPTLPVQGLPYTPVDAIQVHPPCVPFVAKPLTEREASSRVQLLDVLGMNSDRPTAGLIPFPSSEDSALVEAKTVEDALPLIGNMIKADRERTAGTKRPYPRTALKHQHIVAFMLCNPFATTTEICSFFGISPTTLSTVYKSDTFKSLVASHRVSIESGIGGDLQAQLRDTLAAAVEVVQKAVVDRQDPDYALEVLDKAANRLGLGAKHNTGPQVQVNIVTPEMIAAARASRSLR